MGAQAILAQIKHLRSFACVAQINDHRHDRGHSCRGDSERLDLPAQDETTAPTIRVLISSLAGEMLELDINSARQIIDLKGMISDKWQVPPLCQCLLLDS